MRVRVICALFALVAWGAAATPAPAADPGRWVETGYSPVPFEYFQGVTSDRHKNLWFDGFFSGLYRTDPDLNEQARNFNAIPFEVSKAEGYNHIGDISWDRHEHGRILLPLECYFPIIGNFCGTGAIGVADPETLAWRYYVKLDPAFINKAMWTEASPNGKLLWTSSGSGRRPARLRHGRHHRLQRHARRHASRACSLSWTARCRRSASPARPSTSTACWWREGAAPCSRRG